MIESKSLDTRTCLMQNDSINLKQGCFRFMFTMFIKAQEAMKTQSSSKAYPQDVKKKRGSFFVRGTRHTSTTLRRESIVEVEI